MTEPLRYDPVEAALLLRELAGDLLEADGAARNGLFIELHRLHDTLFRMALESHPDAAPALAAQAFAVEGALPAPQVVRELQDLNSPLVTREIQALYKHMNRARNNLAHEAVVERLVVSRANSKRMARLARLLADQLDPHGEGQPPEEQGEEIPDVGGFAFRRSGYLLVGLAAGAAMGWATTGAQGPGVTLILGALILVAILATLYRDRRDA